GLARCEASALGRWMNNELGTRAGDAFVEGRRAACRGTSAGCLRRGTAGSPAARGAAASQAAKEGGVRGSPAGTRVPARKVAFCVVAASCLVVLCRRLSFPGVVCRPFVVAASWFVAIGSRGTALL